MAENLMDSYNPLYDVHLRQYFASPHMQKHLRNLGLLQGDDSEDYCDENQLYARHHMMMDMMLRNRETQLAKLADIQKKLDAAEKIEICRKIRSGITSPETFRRAKPSRSLSRSRFSALNRKRRSSTSTDDKDLIKKIESDTAEPQDGDPNYVYNRLSASAGKFRYMHKLDDETLSAYMEQLRRQLDKLERFREVSFGPNSVAKHQTEPHLSWFFRRRSVQSLKHRSRLGKSSSPRKLDESDNSADSYPRKMMRPSSIESRRLPPITRNDNSGQSSTASSTAQNLPARARTVHQKRRSKSRKSDEPVRMTKAKPKEDTVSKLALIGVPALAGGVTAAASVGLATAANSETPNPVMPSPPKPIEEPQQSAEDMGSAGIDGFRGNESTEETSKEATLLSVTPPATEITEKYEDELDGNQQQCVNVNEEQLDAVEGNPPSDEVNDHILTESPNTTKFDQPRTASIESRPEEVFRDDESTGVTPGEADLLSVTPPVTEITEKYKDEPDKNQQQYVSNNGEQLDAVEGNPPPDVSTDHNLIESPNKTEFDESQALAIESRSQEAFRSNESTEETSMRAALLSVTPPATEITEKCEDESNENQQQYVSNNEEQLDAVEENPPPDEINDRNLSESLNKTEFDQPQTVSIESRPEEVFRGDESTEVTPGEAALLSVTPPVTEITEKYEDEPININEEQSDAVEGNPPPDVSTDHNLIESSNKIEFDESHAITIESRSQEALRDNVSTEIKSEEATVLSMTPPETEITEKYKGEPDENQQQYVSNNEEQLDAVKENPPSDEINDRNLSESLNKTEFDQPQTATIESRREEVFRGDESTEVTPGEEALLSVTPPVTKITEKYEDEPVNINEEQSDAVEGNLPPDVSTDLIESPNKVEFNESHAVTIESRSQEALRDNVSTEVKSEEATVLSMTPPETKITEKYKGEPDENQQQYVSISEEQFDALEGNHPLDEINDHDLSESPNKVEFDQLQTAGTESRSQEAFRSNELTEETSKEASGTPPLTKITEKYEDEPNENQQQYVSINEEQSDAVQENPPPDVSTDHNLIESPNKIDSDQPQGVSTETHFQEISSENGENKRSAEDEGEVLIEEEAAIAETSKDDHLDEEIPKYETALQLEAPAPSDLQGSLESPIVEGQTFEEAAKSVELPEPDTESIVRHSVSSLENQNEKQLELLSTENTASEEVMQPSSDRLSDKATASEQDEMTKKTLQDDSIIESLEHQDQPTELIQSQSEEIMKHEVVPVQSAALDSTLFEESVENDRTADDHMMGSRAEQSVSGREQAEPDVVEATMQQVESSKPSEITDARITDAVSVQNSDHKEIERKLMNEFENGEDHIPGEDNESVVDVKTIESQQLVSPVLSSVHESDEYDEADQKEKRRSEDDKSTLIFPPDVLLILKRTNDIAEEEAFVNPTRVQQITANPESSKMETGPDGTSSIVDGKDDTVSLDNINQDSGHNLNDVDMGKFDDSSSVVNVDSNGISIATQGILNDDSSGVTEKLVVDNIDIVNASESPKLTESESTEERFADGSRRVDEVAHSREAGTLNVAPFVAEESPIDGERLNESILELPPTVEGAVSQSENPPEVLQESQTGQFLSSNAFIEMEQHSMKEQRTEDEVSYLENNNQEQKSVSADDANDLIGDIVLQNKQPTAELHETSLEDHKSSPISEALIDNTNEPTQTLQIGDESPTLIGKPSEECEKVDECNERESNIDDATVLHTKHVQSTTANIPSEYIKYESDRTVEKSDANHLDQLKKDQPEDCGSIITVPSEEIINLRPENAINDEGVDEVAEDAKVCKQSCSGDAFNVSLEGVAAENLKNFIDENANIPSTANDEHDTMSNSPSGALPDRLDGNEMKSEEQATLLNLSGSVAATTTDEHFRCGEEEEMNTETTPLLDHSKEAARHVLI